MLAVIQRVTAAHVSVITDSTSEIVGQIGPGLVVLAAIESDDSPDDTSWMAGKLATLRIFKNADKYFDLDVNQINGSILLISNFTVAAETAKGRRPSLSKAAPPDAARSLFDQLLAATRALVPNVQTGRFQAEMRVHIENEGPVTMLLNSKQR